MYSFILILLVVQYKILKELVHIIPYTSNNHEKFQQVREINSDS